MGPPKNKPEAQQLAMVGNVSKVNVGENLCSWVFSSPFSGRNSLIQNASAPEMRSHSIGEIDANKKLVVDVCCRKPYTLLV